MLKAVLLGVLCEHIYNHLTIARSIVNPVAEYRERCRWSLCSSAAFSWLSGLQQIQNSTLNRGLACQFSLRFAFLSHLVQDPLGSLHSIHTGGNTTVGSRM